MNSHWPHAPEHRLFEDGAYCVTVATYQKEHFFYGDDRLGNLCKGLLKYAAKHSWSLQAWAVFPNHYHFVAKSPKNSAHTLNKMLQEFHSRSARWANQLDGVTGRKIWHNYWETYLSYEKSYYARLNYVHQNAVKHGVVNVASDYPWCSAGWFEKSAPKSFVKTVYRFPTDRVNIVDDF
jgi:putative transposase